MAKLDLLVLVAIAAFQAVRLVGVEVRDGADLQPTLLCLGIDLEVETDGRGEAHVTATQTENAIGQL